MNPAKNPPSWFTRLPPVGQKLFPIACSLVTGVIVGLILHYVLYRIGLPSKPFIYVAF